MKTNEWINKCPHSHHMQTRCITLNHAHELCGCSWIIHGMARQTACFLLLNPIYLWADCLGIILLLDFCSLFFCNFCKRVAPYLSSKIELFYYFVRLLRGIRVNCILALTQCNHGFHNLLSSFGHNLLADLNFLTLSFCAKQVHVQKIKYAMAPYHILILNRRTCCFFCSLANASKNFIAKVIFYFVYKYVHPHWWFVDLSW